MTKQEFAALTKHPVLLDGATGSNLMAAGMPRGVCTEQWVLDHPEIMIQLQREYIQAGSQIVYAPTFGGNRINLKKHGLSDQLSSLNQRLVALSLEAAKGTDTLIAGDITTTGELLEPLGDLTYQEAFDTYCEQTEVLVSAGVDLIVAETMLSIEETVAAIDAVHEVCDLPILCSVTCQADGSLFFGGTALSAAQAFAAAGADAVGLNCSVGPSELPAQIRSIVSAVSLPVIAKPNAGMPQIDAHGTAHYDIRPEDYAAGMKLLLDAGATLVGGCCGTTPEFIRALKKLL